MSCSGWCRNPQIAQCLFSLLAVKQLLDGILLKECTLQENEECPENDIPRGECTPKIKMEPEKGLWKRKNVYKPPILGFHVSFRGCSLFQPLVFY